MSSSAVESKSTNNNANANNSSSAEISGKIRSAIKAKLMELGAYVDEELPDYIMVMIANKKTKQQMSEDLNLFLGKNSAHFTDWLQDVLDRLQSISRSSASAAIAQVVSQSVAAKDSAATTTTTTTNSASSNAAATRSSSTSTSKHEKEPSKRRSPPVVEPPRRRKVSPPPVRRSPPRGDRRSSSGNGRGGRDDYYRGTCCNSRSRYDDRRRSPPPSSRRYNDDYQDDYYGDQRSESPRRFSRSSAADEKRMRRGDDNSGGGRATVGRRHSGGGGTTSGGTSPQEQKMVEQAATRRKKSPPPVSAPQSSRSTIITRDAAGGGGDDDVLVIRAEIDESDELATAVTTGPENSTTIKVSGIEEQSTRVVSFVDNNISSSILPTSTAPNNSRKPIEAPSPDAAGYRRRHVGTVRPMKRRTPSPAEGPSRKRRSTVGQVLHRPDLHAPYHRRDQRGDEEDDDLNEEYDPLRPHMMNSSSTTATVPSAVHVTERKYTVPREMQPKPSIFLRALNEANRSVKITGTSEKETTGGDGDKKNLVIRQSSSLLSSRRTVTERNSGAEKSSSRSVFDRAARGETAESDDLQPQPQPAAAADSEKGGHQRRRIQLRTPTSSGGNSKKPPSSKPPQLAVEDDDEIMIVEDDHRVSGGGAEEDDNIKGNNDAGGPRFTVTISAVDRKFVERINAQENEEQEVGGKQRGNVDDAENDLDTLIVDVDEQELMEEEAMLMGDAADSATATGKSPSSAANAAKFLGQMAKQVVNPIKISLEDDEDDEDFEQNEDVVVVSSAVSQQGSTGGGGGNNVSYSSPVIMDDVQFAGQQPYSTQAMTTTASGRKNVMERCRYWPNCKMGGACQFYHPTMNCKNFPQCRFGDSCLYIHPPCKFGAYCKNPHCPYFHDRTNQQRGPSFPAPILPAFTPRFAPPQTSSGFIPCKFGGRCLNQACPFRHPQAPCMYGASCTNPACAYSHRPNVTNNSIIPAATFPQTPRLIAPLQQRAPVVVSKVADAAKFRWTAPASASQTPMTTCNTDDATKPPTITTTPMMATTVGGALSTEGGSGGAAAIASASVA